MELIQANKVVDEQLQSFLQQNEQIEKEKLLESGYVVYSKEEIIGCFVLESVDALTSYWLKQLFIVSEHAFKLPALLESIIQLAKEQDVKRVHVYSHERGIDILLEALQFTQQKKRNLSFQKKYPSGNWWTYSVS